MAGHWYKQGGWSYISWKATSDAIDYATDQILRRLFMIEEEVAKALARLEVQQAARENQQDRHL